ncbi:MAG: zinc ribbon domain-containing protein, partial [Chloroflexota bacterium]|nr:zinc ribbon domain-containing protein [Chloroflexota bacterium]
MSALIVCPACGAQTPDDAPFCERCSAPVAAMPPRPPAIPAEQANDTLVLRRPALPPLVAVSTPLEAAAVSTPFAAADPTPVSTPFAPLTGPGATTVAVPVAAAAMTGALPSAPARHGLSHRVLIGGFAGGVLLFLGAFGVLLAGLGPNPSDNAPPPAQQTTLAVLRGQATQLAQNAGQLDAAVGMQATQLAQFDAQFQATLTVVAANGSLAERAAAIAQATAHAQAAQATATAAADTLRAAASATAAAI